MRMEIERMEFGQYRLYTDRLPPRVLGKRRHSAKSSALDAKSAKAC